MIATRTSGDDLTTELDATKTKVTALQTQLDTQRDEWMETCDALKETNAKLKLEHAHQVKHKYTHDMT